MRWLKFGIVVLLLLIAAYAISMSFVDESKSFKIEKEINYPVEKVYPQFANLQNFSIWNEVFASNPDLSFDFFVPYEGQGSSMSYQDKKILNQKGEIFIRYANPNKTLRYQLFEYHSENPYLIDVKFLKIAPNKTKTIWTIHTPKQPYLKRSVNLFSEDFFAKNIDKSLNNLAGLLSNKVDKESKMALIKFDSLMVENLEGDLILGVNVTTANKKDNLFKNIVLNHNKTLNFIRTDLHKKDDEFGAPIMLMDANSFNQKEISYFYGVPLSKRIGVSDNNFTFRTLNPSKAYVMYYKGTFAGRIKPVQQLLLKAKRDSMRNGELQQTFIEEPNENKDIVMKLALPVFR